MLRIVIPKRIFGDRNDFDCEKENGPGTPITEPPNHFQPVERKNVVINKEPGHILFTFPVLFHALAQYRPVLSGQNSTEE